MHFRRALQERLLALETDQAGTLSLADIDFRFLGFQFLNRDGFHTQENPLVSKTKS